MDNLPKKLSMIVDQYLNEIIDETTIQHINGHLQTVAPGDYKVYWDGQDESLKIQLYFDDPKKYTWWVLQNS